MPASAGRPPKWGTVYDSEDRCLEKHTEKVINPAVSKGDNGKGEFSRTIPAGLAPSSLYKVKITTADNLFSDQSGYPQTGGKINL